MVLKKINTAVFISGNGCNLKNLIKFSLSKKSPIKIIFVISKKKNAKGLKQNIWPLFEKKKIKPILCKTFPFDKVKDAHIYMDKGLHFGKIALIF